MIYLDNAATTLVKPKSVGKAVFDVIDRQIYGNPSRGAHQSAINAYEVVFKARQKIQQLFNVPSESLVSFTTNATEALNIAIKGLLKPGDHVIATAFDHNSVLRPIYQLEAAGVAHSFVGLDAKTGELQLNQLASLLQTNTKMIICTHASNVIGDLVDIKRISEFCQRHHLLFVLDASQTAGVVPIDMQASHIDVLCFTGHKSLYGPQGTGGICFLKPLQITPLLSGGSGIDSFNHSQPPFMPERLEAGTLNVPGIAGLSAGVDYCLKQGVSELGSKALKLADQFILAMAGLDKVEIYSHLMQPHTATVGINITGLDSSEVSDLLSEQGIATRPGAHCAPLIHEALGTKQRGIIRFSFSSFNTAEETKQVIAAVTEITKSMEE
ncbi:aminotransferase class V-fold PLP-dependent enzyme [Loigolactobacillus iwatensis]|uniref:aminotransferase class V-fold PLP-dependent enzyme n=1 Tax=Loigolactobacillus iwatensis TaxID=1267156 RepID=UPI000F7EFB08|nr:aminotransferase class V-fold PLP-dependent enzyme [Loigolactobacillus iwatensis]